MEPADEYPLCCRDEAVDPVIVYNVGVLIGIAGTDTLGRLGVLRGTGNDGLLWKAKSISDFLHLMEQGVDRGVSTTQRPTRPMN